MKGSAATKAHPEGLPKGIYEVKESITGYYLNRLGDSLLFMQLNLGILRMLQVSLIRYIRLDILNEETDINIFIIIKLYE